MVWAGRPLLAYLLYAPAAVVGTLLAHNLLGPLQPQQLLWGFALFAGALAEVLSWAGLGMAYTLAAWAMCALGLAAMHAAVRAPPGKSLIWHVAWIHGCNCSFTLRCLHAYHTVWSPTPSLAECICCLVPCCRPDGIAVAEGACLMQLPVH